MLKARVNAQVLAAEDAGWDGDALEAEGFAYLAVRSKKGLPLSLPTTTGVQAAHDRREILEGVNLMLRRAQHEE